MTNEEREKKTRIANMLIGTIKDLRTPMLMYQVEKDVAKEALENYIKALEQQPCEDCISRKEMLKYQEYLHGKMSNEENHKLWEFIKQLPSVTPKPEIGHWILLANELYMCSECYAKWTMRLNYCPDCGAKMKEDAE